MCPRAIVRAVVASVSSTDRLLGGEEGIRAEDAARLGRVLGRDEVGVGAPGALRGEGQHLRREGGDDASRRRRGSDGDKRRAVHRIEIAPHRGQRFPVVVAAHADERRMAHAHAEEETIGIGFGERLLRRRHRGRVAHPDVGDPGRDHDARRPGEEQRRLVNASRPTASGVQMAPYPSASISTAAAWACVAGCWSRAAVQMPIRPRFIASTLRAARYRGRQARPSEIQAFRVSIVARGRCT